ncbi:MAG: hypothetical protein ACPGJE_09850, partial [Wenzhouxiangellaceae bacterium]
MTRGDLVSLRQWPDLDGFQQLGNRHGRVRFISRRRRRSADEITSLSRRPKKAQLAARHDCNMVKDRELARQGGDHEGSLTPGRVPKTPLETPDFIGGEFGNRSAEEQQVRIGQQFLRNGDPIAQVPFQSSNPAIADRTQVQYIYTRIQSIISLVGVQRVGQTQPRREL